MDRVERDEEKELTAEEKKAEKLKAFWQEYETMTVGKVITAAARGDADLRNQILEHERATTRRASIIQTLQAWDD